MRRLAWTLAVALFAGLAAVAVGLPAAPAAAEGTEVLLTEADSGRTITLALNQRLRIDLHPDSGDIWSDVDAESALHRFELQVSSSLTTARFTALSPTAGQAVTATTDTACFHSQPACMRPSRQWQVTVIVEDRTDPGPSPSPQACQPSPMPALAPGTVLVEEGADGQTVQVPQGDRLLVVFGGCKSDGVDYRPAEGSGPLYRDRASGRNPGGASSSFFAMSLGTTTVTAVRDAPCLHVPDGCVVTAQVWQVTVEVVQSVEPGSCTMTGAATAAAGTAVRLSGYAGSQGGVQVWFKSYGAAGYVVRRQLTAASDGSFSTSFTPVVDHRWYATASGCTTEAGLTQVQPTVRGPASVARGATVPVLVRGFAGQPVALYARRFGGTYRLARTGRLDATGTFRTSFVADVDHRYYVVTGPDRRTSAPALTQVR